MYKIDKILIGTHNKGKFKEISKLITGSQCKIIEKGRHLCNIECAENFNITIGKFIENNA